MEEAFRLNVKWSLQELSRAINGDGKSVPNPLLRVKVVLEGDKVSWKIYCDDHALFTFRLDRNRKGDLRGQQHIPSTN